MDDVREPLILALGDLSPHTNQKNPMKSRTYRCCESAPLAEYVPLKTTDTGSVPVTEFICRNLLLNFHKVATFLAVYLGIGKV
ncbi:hypothetical protein CerSpe_161350 [Prunus speciosa]